MEVREPAFGRKRKRLTLEAEESDDLRPEADVDVGIDRDIEAAVERMCVRKKRAATFEGRRTQ